MASCYQEIVNRIDEIQQIETLVPYTNMEFEVSFSKKVLYLFETIMQQNCKFDISLSSIIPPSTIGVTINFYQIIDTTIIFLGSASITEMNMEFQKDFNPGTFIICISSIRSTYSGIIYRRIHRSCHFC